MNLIEKLLRVDKDEVEKKKACQICGRRCGDHNPGTFRKEIQ